MSKLTDEDKAWAFRKREIGWSCKSIADRLGCSAGAINYQCLVNGVVSPNQRNVETPEESYSYQGRDGRTFRTFTRAEDDRLLALARGGTKLDALARTLDRPRTSVRMRLLLLERREEMAS